MNSKKLILSNHTKWIIGLLVTVFLAVIGYYFSYYNSGNQKNIMILIGLVVFAILPIIGIILAIYRNKKHCLKTNELTLEQGNDFYIKGRKCYNKGKYDEAIEFYLNAILFYPKHAKEELAKTHFAIGNAYQMNRKNHRNDTDKTKELTQNAIDSYKEAFNLKEDSATAFKLKELHEYLGNYGSEWKKI